MSKPIRDHIAKLVRPSVWEAGRKRFEEGAVLDLRGDPKALQARVANEVGQFEQVRVLFRKDGFATRCTCREFGSPCSHAVAVLLQIAEEMPEYFGFLACVETLPVAENGPEPPPVASSGQGALNPQQTVAPLRSSRQPLVKCSLDSLIAAPTVRAELRLCIRQNLHLLDLGRNRITMRAFLEYGGREYSAGNIKKLVDGVEAAGGMVLTDFPLQEQQAMRFLACHAELSGSDYTLTAEAAADLLHCLIGFEHLYSDDGHVQVHRDCAQPVLRLSREQEGHVVTPRVMLPGHGLLPVGTVLPIVGRGGAWIGVKRHYWWLPGIVDPGLMRFLIRGEGSRVGAEDIRRLSDACQRSRGAVRLIAEEQHGDLQITAGHCRPVLTLDWDQKWVKAVLELDYDGVRLPSGRSSSAWAGSDFVIRDPDAEGIAVERLKQLGFTPDGALPDHFRLVSQVKLWEFLHSGLEALGGEWKLYTSREFDAKRAASTELQLKVQTHAETDSWFELTCDMLSAGGGDLKWENVMNTFSEGGQFLTLADGTLIRIPEQVRQIMDFLQRRAITHTDNLFRFHIYSALPIADGVEPFEIGGQAKWRQLRERLTSKQLRPDVKLPPQLQETLRDYQKDGVAWMAVLAENGFHGVLADEMGLGKTIQALAMLAWRRETMTNRKPSLVVCPTSLIENWLLEAERFAPGLKTLAVLGLERLELLRQVPETDLVITSYALLRRDIAQYQKVEFDYVILDEAQHIKNPGTANARTCKILRAEHRLILTGTPLENSMRDVWSLFDFLLPGLLGTQQEFRKMYETSAPAGAPPERTAGRLGAVLRPFILRRTKDEVCKQLPPKMEQVIFCHLNARQQRLHQNMLAAGREMVRVAREKGWNSCRFELLSLLMRLRQLCCHPDLLPEELQAVEGENIPSAKTELLQELILEAIDGGHRILLFSQFTSFLHLIQPWLKEEGIAYEYMDGATRDRQARVDRFNRDPSIPLFLLSLKAGGTGLNLTGADTAILYDPWWNPMVEDQATDRIHRIGQEKPVTAYKLVAHHSIEEKVLHLQESKRELFDQLMAGVPAKVGELTPEDFEFLFNEDS